MVGYRIVDASAWPVAAQEPAGDTEHDWLIDESGALWLFKPVVIKQARQGEDWAEKLACEVAAMLAIPAAQIEMAVRNGVEGCLSHHLRPDLDWQSHAGSVLLSEVITNYDRKGRDRTGHSLAVVREVLRGYRPPPGSSAPEGMDAFGMFAGYLVLDALIANQDRHSDNWSVLIAPDGGHHLMASYDHASAFGFGMTDEGRQAVLLAPDGPERWARRGRALKFENGKNISLVGLAAEALSMLPEKERGWWLDRVRIVGGQEYNQIVAATPRMSEAAREFCLRLLEVNRRRLFDDFV